MWKPAMNIRFFSEMKVSTEEPSGENEESSRPTKRLVIETTSLCWYGFLTRQLRDTESWSPGAAGQRNFGKGEDDSTQQGATPAGVYAVIPAQGFSLVGGRDTQHMGTKPLLWHLWVWVKSAHFGASPQTFPIRIPGRTMVTAENSDVRGPVSLLASCSGHSWDFPLLSC